MKYHLLIVCLFLIFWKYLPAQKTLPLANDTIPFVLTEYNNIKVRVLLNDTDSLELKFDSGATGLLLTHEAIATKTKLLESQNEKKPTQDYQKLEAQSRLQIGKLRWDHLDVYPVTLSGHGTDGRFGWDLFEGRILEINYDKNIMVVHSQLPKNAKDYTRLKIEYVETLFCVEGRLFAGKKHYKSRFLIDTGYQKALLLDSVLMAEQNFPKDLPVVKITRLRNGAGKVFETKVVNCEKLMLRQSSLKNIPTQLLNTDNPAGFKTHILGNELLKRYNAYFDFQQNHIYLRLNSLELLPYGDV
ncbi:MAG: clan AA aspartic protease [Bacteroidia bacterium]